MKVWHKSVKYLFLAKTDKNIIELMSRILIGISFEMICCQNVNQKDFYEIFF